VRYQAVDSRRAQVAGPRAALDEIERISSHPALAAYHLLPERRFLGARLASLAD
jgi:predicted RNA polymerase sigma factor